MLKSANISFNKSNEKLAIEFKTENLNSNILEIVTKEKDVFIDSEKLLLVNEKDNGLIALLYKVDVIDAKVGWIQGKICLVTNNLGFIISPMCREERKIVKECYNAIKSGLFKAYFNSYKLDKGIVELVIIYKI